MDYRKRPKNYFIIIGILVVVIGLDLLGVFGMVKSFVLQGAGNVKSMSVIRTSFNKVADMVKNVSDLDEDNKKLLNERKELLSKVTTIKELEKENEELKKALLISGFKEASKEEVKIVSNILQGEQGSFFINKGKADDIVEGQIIIDGDGYLIGKVDKVYSYSSECIYSTSLHPELPIIVAGKSVQGIVKADTDGWLFNMIPKDKEIEVGDILLLGGDNDLLSNSSKNVPVIIGKVKEITSKDQDIFYKGIVDPIIDRTDIAIGFVLK